MSAHGMNIVARWRAGRRRVHHWLWAEHPLPPERARGIRRLTLAVVIAWREMAANDLSTRASALGFWILLSLVPVLALVFAIVHMFAGLEGAGAYLLDVLSAGHPGVAEAISEYVRATQAATLGGAGVLGLVVVGFTVLQRVKRALNRIWQVDTRPHYGQRLVEYLVVLSVTPFLMMLPVAISAALKSDVVQMVREANPLLSQAHFLLASVSGYPIYWIVLFYAYAFLPDTRVRMPHALLGAVVAGTLLHVVQQLYIGAMLRLTVYNMIYGALALLPVLMIWLFLASVIFLFGAQLAYVTQHHHYLCTRRELSGRREAERAFQAVRLLVTLLREFEQAGHPVPLTTLTRESGLPGGVVRDLMRWLRRSGLILAATRRQDRFAPAVPLAGLTLASVLKALGLLPALAVGPLGREAPALAAVLAEADGAAGAHLARAAIADLLRPDPPAGAEAPRPQAAG